MRNHLRNSQARFGLVAISFHWFTALLFLGNIGLGLYMTSLPLGDPNLFPLFQFHKSIGILVFALVLLRLLWRLIDKAPALPQNMPAWEKQAARAAHIGLYAILVAMPLSGWVIVSASPYNIPTLFFGGLQLPHLDIIATSPEKDLWLGRGELTHWLVAWASLAGVFLHGAAALRHHFLLKDDVLRRMLPTKNGTEKDHTC